MGIGDKKVNGHIDGFKDEIANAYFESKDSFYSWFNNNKSTDEAFIRGQWDFAIHFAPHLVDFLAEPESKTVLEIGFGGGRILAAAARYFGKAYGVDIHQYSSFVKEELDSRGIKNTELICSDGKHLPLPANSVDAVYSFIVFQHVEKIEIFKKYLEEIYRVLSDKGVAVIYFGRLCKFSKGKSNLLYYILDRILEKFILIKGYLSKKARINETNLLMTVPYVKKLAKEMGFAVEGSLVSYRYVPSGKRTYGGQSGLVIRKLVE